ncbi:hypothetical protein ALC56_05104, partial [Trachymyrmex septentrionalis]
IYLNVLSGVLVELLGSCSRNLALPQPTNVYAAGFLNIFHILFQCLWYNPLPPSSRGSALNAEKLDKTSGTRS